MDDYVNIIYVIVSCIKGEDMACSAGCFLVYFCFPGSRGCFCWALSGCAFGRIGMLSYCDLLRLLCWFVGSVLLLLALYQFVRFQRGSSHAFFCYTVCPVSLGPGGFYQAFAKCFTQQAVYPPRNVARSFYRL